jgi:phosphodiesterase/alkaline phosphatase D-like protein
MAEHLRTQAGPWCGGLTDGSVVIKASVLKSVKTARVIVAQNEGLTQNPIAFPLASLWSDPDHSYRHKIATFAPTGLGPNTQYFFRLELDGDTTKAFPGRFRTAPTLGTPSGFRFAVSGCANPFPKHRPEAYDAIGAIPNLLFFFHLGDFHYDNIGDEVIDKRLEAYDDTLRREAVGDLFRCLPIVYCWDDHDFLGNNSDGGDPDKAVVRRFARDAYSIYVPHYPLVSTTEGIHQFFQIGRVLFLLMDGRFSKSPKKGSGTSGKTVLGLNQKAWLKDQLVRGKELDLIVWASSFPGSARMIPVRTSGRAMGRSALSSHSFW